MILAYLRWFSIILSLGIASVCAQDYPSKPIRMVTGGIGGGVDFMARLLAQGLTVSFGQQVIVDNRPSGFVPGQIVSKALPDGYTLLVAGGTFTTGSLLQKTPYDPVSDFLPITCTAGAAAVLVVNPSVPVHTVDELIAFARTHPGELNYTTSSIGGSGHLQMELFKAMAGVNIVHVAYKSSATEMTDLLGGQVQLTFSNAATVEPHLKSGRLRALAVTSAKPSALFPGLPTIAASLPGYESITVMGTLAPLRTPDAIIRRLNREIVKVLNTSEVKQKLLSSGLEVIGSSPEQYAAMIKSEMAKWIKLIDALHIRAD